MQTCPKCPKLFTISAMIRDALVTCVPCTLFLQMHIAKGANSLLNAGDNLVSLLACVMHGACMQECKKILRARVDDVVFVNLDAKMKLNVALGD